MQENLQDETICDGFKNHAGVTPVSVVGCERRKARVLAVEFMGQDSLRLG